jgi:peptidoglycan hydrolase CwlO-like protein
MNKSTLILAQTQPQSSMVSVEPGLLMVGGILFSVIATTVTVSFFLSGLKQAISEVNARINQIAIENKASNDQIILRITLKEESVKTLEKKLERLQGDLLSLMNFINQEMKYTSSHRFQPRPEED